MNEDVEGWWVWMICNWIVVDMFMWKWKVNFFLVSGLLIIVFWSVFFVLGFWKKVFNLEMWLRVEVEYFLYLSKKCDWNLVEVLCKVIGEFFIVNILFLNILFYVN